MESIMVTLSPELCRTRMLVSSEGRDVLKAVLPPVQSAHPKAVATLLEGLSLWTQQRLCVALVVDEQGASCDARVLCDALGYGERTLHYEVGIAARHGRRRHRRIDGVGDFRDLRQLSLEVIR